MRNCFCFFLCLIFFISGCANTNGQDTQKNTIILNVLAGQSSSDAGVEDVINDYVAEHFPQVTLHWETAEWGDEFDETLRADFASGEVPDIIIGKAQNVSSYYKTGNLAEITMPLEHYVESDSLRDVTINNKVYGIPYNKDYQGVIYNKDIFARLGLNIPRTGADLEHIVSVCENYGVTPFAFCCQNNYALTSNTMQFMLNEIFKYDYNWGDQFRLGETFIDQCDEVLPCFNNHKYMLEHSWKDANQIEQYECDTRFATGGAAMYMTSTWALSNIQQSSDNENFGIFPYPNLQGDASLIQESNMTFMKSNVTKYGKVIDDIFLSFIKSKELANEVSQATQTISVIKGTKSVYPNSLKNDIGVYEAKGKIMDSLIGYNQLSWNYLSEISQKQLEWMNDYTTLDKVLAYAELKRPDSDSMR